MLGQLCHNLIFGLRESSKGTPRHIRLTSDLTAVTATLSSLDSSITDHSIHDCFRLGKYNDSRTRPVFVRLARACEALSVLSQRYKLAKSPGISIKPDLSPKERAIESMLLKECRALITSGVDHKEIKIRGNERPSCQQEEIWTGH